MLVLHQPDPDLNIMKDKINCIIPFVNCVNNKMLKSDWFFKALIYGLIWLLQHQTVRFNLSDY